MAGKNYAAPRSIRHVMAPALVAALAAISACSAGPDESSQKAKSCSVLDAPLPTAAGCNPLAPEWGDCLLPWPADVFRRPTATGPSATRLQVPMAALPFHQDSGTAIDFLARKPADGFSRLPTIAVRAPGGFAVPAGVGYPLASGARDPASSAAASHPTLILDVTTGEFVPHFIDYDDRIDSADSARALVLRPLRPLGFGRTYAVALRAKGGDGAVLRADLQPHTSPASFIASRAAALDGGDDAAACWLQATVLRPLADAGVAADDLLLAWSFTTEAKDFVAADLVAVRAAALASFAALPVAATVVEVMEPPSGALGRRVELRLTVPLYLESTASAALLHRDASGVAAQNGSAEVPATVWIPRSVLQGTAPQMIGGRARIIQFGHGFFGNRSEAAGFGLDLASEHGFIVAAVDWWGMSLPDRQALIAGIFADPSGALAFVDRLHQAMVNQLALSDALSTTLPTLPALQGPGGTPLLDPGRLYFYGISQGHILGSTFIALSPRIERAVLAVGAVGFGQMMSRAAPFGPFLALFQLAAGDAASAFDLTLLLQTVLDRVDPVVWLEELSGPSLPGAPASRTLLQHVAVADTSVPNFASHFQARALGMPLLSPSPRPVYGLTPKPSPIAGSALVEWDFGHPLPDLLGAPVTSENPAHNAQRQLSASMKQVDRFLRPDGKVEATCDGPCDPE